MRAWLIGPFVDAWLRLYPDDRAGARRFLEGFVPHLGEARVAGDGAGRHRSPFTLGGAGLSSWCRLPPRRVEHGGHVFTAEAE